MRNAFSTASEIRGHIDGSINELARHDFAIFKELYDFDLNMLDKIFSYFLLQYSLQLSGTAGYRKRCLINESATVSVR